MNYGLVVHSSSICVFMCLSLLLQALYFSIVELQTGVKTRVEFSSLLFSLTYLNDIRCFISKFIGRFICYGLLGYDTAW
jgi:hypothetical protein